MAGAGGVTVRQIATEVLSLLGVYAPGESIDAADTDTLLFTLNGIVDGWAAEPLLIYQSVPLPFTTIPNKQSYTVGPDNSNDWVTTWLPSEFTRFGTLIATGLENPIEPLTRDQWAAISLKGLASTIAFNVWPSYGNTFHTLYFWPLPAANQPIILYADEQIPRFTTIDNTVALRPGYQELITYELALKAAPKWGADAVVPAWLPVAWQEAKARVKAANFAPIDAECDPALTVAGRRRGGGSIDFYLGK